MVRARKCTPPSSSNGLCPSGKSSAVSAQTVELYPVFLDLPNAGIPVVDAEAPDDVDEEARGEENPNPEEDPRLGAVEGRLEAPRLLRLSIFKDDSPPTASSPPAIDPDVGIDGAL